MARFGSSFVTKTSTPIAFFQNADGGGLRQVLRQNQYGGSFGGPIKKNKIFIFGDYQETRQLNGIAAGGSSSYHLPAIPAGDRSTAAFQQELGSIYCHIPTFYGGFGVPQTQVACDGSNINPVALAIPNLKGPGLVAITCPLTQACQV